LIGALLWLKVDASVEVRADARRAAPAVVA
jgi:hypothetical protein